MIEVDPDRLVALVAAIRGVRVLVVGDVMLDKYLLGGVTRVSPEAPVPIVTVTEERQSPGGAANVAMNAVAVGANCDLVGCVGQDLAGLELEAELERAGISTAALWRDETRCTTVKTRVMNRHHHVARFDREVDDDIPDACAEALATRIEDLAAAADAIAIEDYDKGVLVPRVIRAAIEAGRRHDIPVVVDPKSRHFFEYTGATVFKPNMAELTAALRVPVPMDDAAAFAAARDRVGCRHLLVTMGEHGMALSTEERPFVRIPATARAVFDVSGAGDTVTAVLAVALGAGAEIGEAAVLANLAAGVEVAKPGVATVSPEELVEAIRSAYVPVA